MNCRKAQYYLSAYCDGSLSSDRTTQVEKHLRICNSCERDSLFMKQLRAAAESLPPAMLAEDFNLKLMSRIYAEQNHPTESYLPVEQPSFLHRPAAWATALVTVCLSVFVALTVIRSSKDIATDAGIDQGALYQESQDGTLASTTVARINNPGVYDYVLGVAGDRSNYRATNVSHTRTLHVADDKVESLYVEMQKRLQRVAPNQYLDYVSAGYSRQTPMFPYKQAPKRNSLLHQAASRN